MKMYHTTIDKKEVEMRVWAKKRSFSCTDYTDTEYAYMCHVWQVLYMREWDSGLPSTIKLGPLREYHLLRRRDCDYIAILRENWGYYSSSCPVFLCCSPFPVKWPRSLCAFCLHSLCVLLFPSPEAPSLTSDLSPFWVPDSEVTLD